MTANVDMDAHAFGVGWTTTGTRDEAVRLAREAVDRGLAGCAQVSGPITSIYRWEGAREESEEFRITFKFVWGRRFDLERWLAEAHSYAVPQWICCQAGGGSEKYLKWLETTSS